MDPQQMRYQVQAYLEKIKIRLRFMRIDEAMLEARRWVPQTAQMSDADLRSAVIGYYLANGLLLPSLPSQQPPGSPPPPTDPDNKIIDAVKGAITTVINGVDIKRGDGNLNIGVTGVTAELAKGDAKLSAGVSWGGTLSVEASKKNFFLQGELSKDSWKITLSYPQETAIPDLSKLGKVFGEGEKAMRGIIGATSGISDLKNIQQVKDNIKPYMGPVKDAVEAAQGIASAPKSGGVSLGLSFGSPDPLPGQTDMPKGVQVAVTLTVLF